jgi:hypothetical protein
MLSNLYHSQEIFIFSFNLNFNFKIYFKSYNSLDFNGGKLKDKHMSLI